MSNPFVEDREWNLQRDIIDAYNRRRENVEELFECPNCRCNHTQEHWESESNIHFQSTGSDMYTFENSDSHIEYYCTSCNSTVEFGDIRIVEETLYTCTSCNASSPESLWDAHTDAHFGGGTVSMASSSGRTRHVCPSCNTILDHRDLTNIRINPNGLEAFESYIYEVSNATDIKVGDEVLVIAKGELYEGAKGVVSKKGYGTLNVTLIIGDKIINKTYSKHLLRKVGV